ncbi:MAG: hypothetical protein ACK5LP_04225 [Campylobacteraceae bacterium]
MDINLKSYYAYKFLNTLFFGLSAGTIFIIYEPISPSVYSIGGIILALTTLLIATQYKKMINQKAYFIVLLLVEAVTLLLVLTFLILGKSLLSALIIYSCYQVTFFFGSYALRAETSLLKDIKTFTFIDSIKQVGYLLGLFVAFVFYKVLEYENVGDKVVQVYNIHYILVVVQFTVIFSVIKSFTGKK